MKRVMTTSVRVATLVIVAVLLCNCGKSRDTTVTPPPPGVPPPAATNDVNFWLTKGNETVKLQKQAGILGFSTTANGYPTIEVNEATTYQTVDGFGFTLTGGSAEVINKLDAQPRQDLLKELFGKDSNSVSISYLRLSIGASDLNSAPFTYNDLPAGQTDLALANFSLSSDQFTIVPLLKDILAINPDIRIIAAPWSAPLWMKDKNSFIGGSLQPQYYSIYAQYFVRYIQAMKAQGITVSAVTPQNEPLHDGNNPSMLMTAPQQADFIKNHLGPAFRNAALATSIVVWDHNCDKPDYPIAVLSDATANQFISGSAFHLYAGDISALSTVHTAFPAKDIYFTEQYTPSGGSFSGDLQWHLKNVIIGSMRNWSKVALEWNLANDAGFGPHTPGGCTTCKGAITVEGGSVITRNVGYYIVAHASKFVPQGSKRIESSLPAGLSNVAFHTPSGKKVLIVENDNATATFFNIRYNDRWVLTSLDAGAVGTYIW